MSEQKFDLIVIGSGPAGQKGAICAAKLRKRVAIIDRTVMMGGVCVHTGTIPSKSVREAIFQLTGLGGEVVLRRWLSRHARYFGARSRVSRQNGGEARNGRYPRAAKAKRRRHISGAGRISPTRTRWKWIPAMDKTTLRGDNILIACGTRPAQQCRNSV